MTERYVTIVGEDELCRAVMARLVGSFPGRLAIHRQQVDRGRSNVQRNILAYNNAAKALPQLVLCDLDAAPCALEILAQWFGTTARHRDLMLRLAKPEVEAWLLADRNGIAQLMDVAPAIVPAYPEQESDPKQTLISIARRSPSRAIRDAIVPRLDATIGPDYNGCLAKFVAEVWSSQAAQENSPSLRRAYLRVEELANTPWPLEE